MFAVINDQVRAEIDYTSLQINLSASDPMSSCTFTLVDTGSVINVVEFQETIIIDNDAFPNQTINLLQNPLLNPYTSVWTTTTHTGTPASQASPNGAKVTVTNAAVGTQPKFWQNTQTGLVTGGQTYTASCFVTGTSIVAVQASITLTFLDGLANVLTTQTSTPVTPTGSPQSISTSLLAPANAQTIQVYLNVVPTNATNSGVITFTAAQLEPQLFATYGTTYPTPQCTSDQTNCVLLPNGTTCRQQRLFTGFITHLLYDTFAGPNRLIHVDCTGPAFLMETTIDFESVTNMTDGAIIRDLMNDEFNAFMPNPPPFSTNHVQDGITLDSFTLANDTIRVGLDNIASITGWRWYVDPYYDVWYLPVGFYATAFNLSDTPDNINTFSYSNYSREVDFTQPCNSAYVQWGNTGNANHTWEGQSMGKYNYEFQRKVSTQSITTVNTAIQRAQAEVIQFAYGRTIIHLEVDARVSQPILPGNTIQLTNSVDGITNPTTFLVQKVVITCLGIDKQQQTRWLYTLDLGSYQAELANILLHAANDATQTANTVSWNVGTHNMVIVETLGCIENYTHTP